YAEGEADKKARTAPRPGHLLQLEAWWPACPRRNDRQQRRGPERVGARPLWPAADLCGRWLRFPEVAAHGSAAGETEGRTAAPSRRLRRKRRPGTSATASGSWLLRRVSAPTHGRWPARERGARRGRPVPRKNRGSP